jgi:hypothetical protein
MLNKAIEKLKAEIGANKNNEYIKVVGEFLLNFLGEHPEAAEKIMTADKTIAKSLDEMKRIASTKKVGNMAMFTPQEGFSIVMKYFGIESGVAPQQVIESTLKSSNVNRPIETQKAKPAIDLDIKLEDLL